MGGLSVDPMPALGPPTRKRIYMGTKNLFMSEQRKPRLSYAMHMQTGMCLS